MIALRLSVLVLACLACAPNSVVVKAPAYQGQGGVRGNIVDATSGAPVKDAYVMLAVGAKARTTAALTDAEGAFEFTNLQPGEYQLVVEKGGYRVASPTPVVVTPDEDFVARIQLRPGTGPSDQVTLDKVIEPPIKLSGPDPAYTWKALNEGVQGTMLIRCIITAEGDVRDCVVRKGLRHMDDAVLQALQARKYRPARLGGHPIDVSYIFRINLRLP